MKSFGNGILPLLINQTVPAIYYAHLASHRARSHIDKSYDTLQREKELAKVGLVISEQRETETKPLIPMANQSGIRYGMWYI